MKSGIDEKGNKYWYNDKKQFHNIIEPAFVKKNGWSTWARSDQLHRLDGPYETSPYGIQSWAWLGRPVSEQHHTLISNRKFFTRRVQI